MNGSLQRKIQSLRIACKLGKNALVRAGFPVGQAELIIEDMNALAALLEDRLPYEDQIAALIAAARRAAH